MAQINQFQIVSNGVILDTYDNLDFSFTYQINDIEDLTQKKSSYSKTILLPGTKTNQDYFKQIQEINIDISNSSYNPKKSLPVEVKVNDELIFIGNIQLLSIVTNQKQVDFEVVITGVFKNIIIALADYYLNQLNLDEYNHVRNINTITAATDNLIYINGLLTQSQPGTGYIYPIIINGNSQFNTNQVIFNSIDLNPAIYLKTLLDKLFQFAGYTYTSNFLNSPYFKSLIVPLESPQYEGAEINDKTVRVGINPNLSFSATQPGLPQPNNLFFQGAANTGVSTGSVSPFSIIPPILNGYTPLGPGMAKSNNWWYNNTNGSWWMNFNLETGGTTQLPFQDPNGQWSTNYLGNQCTYFAQESGYYSINLNLNMQGFYVSSNLSSFRWLSGQLSYLVQIWKISPNGQSYLLQTSNVNGTPFSPSSTAALPGKWLDPTPLNLNLNIPNAWLNAGEQIRVRLAFRYPTNVSWQSTTPNIYFMPVAAANNQQLNYLEIKPATTINYSINSLLKLSEMLPSLKMKDLFLDVVKMFNLMVYDDPALPGNLIIEPRDDFYESKPRVKDWTYKLDYNEDILQTPMSELDIKSYKFTYQEDSDFYNKEYKNIKDAIWGEYQVDFINDFSTQEKKLELQIAPTPISNKYLTKVAGLVAPFFCDIDSNNGLKPIKVKPRILFTKKLYTQASTPNPLIIAPYPSSYILRNVPTDPITPGPNTFVMFSYAYCGMFDDPYDPKHTLEFGNSKITFTSQFYSPNNTLVNQFYLSSILDLTDVNSKKIEAFFHLTPSDINDFDFRDIIFFEDAYWRVNTIVDYNPNAIDKTTKVILYKLNFLDLSSTYQNEIAESEIDCPGDIVAIQSSGGAFIYVSLSSQPITQTCCDSIGGIWSNGVCKALTGPNQPGGSGGGVPGGVIGSTSPVGSTSNTRSNYPLIPLNQRSSGTIYQESPQSVLKNQNVNNSNDVIIAGSNNFVEAGSKNNMILGDFNTITTDVRNSLIIGDNITNAPSNSIVVGDILIDTDGMRYLNPYKIDAGYETVMNVSKTNLIDIIDAGEDSVRPYGGDSKLRPIIDGSYEQQE